MNEIVHCPKCREQNKCVVCQYLASDAWRCPRCDFEFQLNIMPEVEVPDEVVDPS